MRRPHKKQENQKSIADLWKPVVSEEEKAKLAQRMTDDCTEALAKQAATRVNQPPPVKRKPGRPFGTGKVQVISSGLPRAQVAAAVDPTEPLPVVIRMKQNWWVPALILPILRVVKNKGQWRPAVKHLLAD